MTEKLLFKGGTVVLPNRIIIANLIVEYGKIAGIVTIDNLEGYEVIDVTGKVVLPGLIDTHVHLWDPSPFNYREDWYHGSQCAASGGITTIIDMPLSIPPVTNKESFDIKLQVANKNSFVDFAFWGALIPSCIEQLPILDEMGCVAYKGFMSFATPDYPQITDGYLIKGMKEAAKIDGLIGVHAENAEIADFGSKEMAEHKCKDESMHDEARPWWVELEAIQRATLFSKVTGTRLYICHMTICEGAEYLKKEKCKGTKISIETCPHYLLFDKEILKEKKSFAKCNPPIRSRENREKLWEYLFDGTIDTIGSDHGPYTDNEKVKEGNFWKEYCGFGGFDAMLPGLISEGVHNRKLPLDRLAAITSGNAASILGLYPQKGSLLPGSDADIVVVDLNEEWTYNGLETLSKTKSINNIYHGMKMKGKVKQTWVRGQLVYNGEKIVGSKGYGKFIRKNRP